MKKRARKKQRKKKQRKKKESWQEIIEATIKWHNEQMVKSLIEDLALSQARFWEAKKRGLPFMECLVFASQKTLTK